MCNVPFHASRGSDRRHGLATYEIAYAVGSLRSRSTTIEQSSSDVEAEADNPDEKAATAYTTS